MKHQNHAIDTHATHPVTSPADPKKEFITILGGVPLRGEVQISGSKNAALPLLAAALLAGEGQSIIHNAPDISDVNLMCRVLSDLGASVTREENAIIIDAAHLDCATALQDHVREMRASFYVAAPLLTRMRRAQVALPGGCTIGVRPVDYHIDAFRKMGAVITTVDGAMDAVAHQWHGADIYLEPRHSSFGATVNTMMAASLAPGTTTIEHAAREPEVVELAQFLNKMGAQISGAGTSTVTIEGVTSLHGAEVTVGSDRIEAGTFVSAAIATHSVLQIRGAQAQNLPIFLDKYQEAGVGIFAEDDCIHIDARGKYQAADAEIAPFPGFATDLQPLFLTTMCLAEGKSVIKETLYPERFSYTQELLRMGANIDTDVSLAVVQGVEKLSSAEVEAPDLRAGAALIVAALATAGPTHISNVHHIDRGYENIVHKLRGLGAQAVRHFR